MLLLRHTLKCAQIVQQLINLIPEAAQNVRPVFGKHNLKCNCRFVATQLLRQPDIEEVQRF